MKTKDLDSQLFPFVKGLHHLNLNRNDDVSVQVQPESHQLLRGCFGGFLQVASSKKCLEKMGGRMQVDPLKTQVFANMILEMSDHLIH